MDLRILGNGKSDGSQVDPLIVGGILSDTTSKISLSPHSSSHCHNAFKIFKNILKYLEVIDQIIWEEKLNTTSRYFPHSAHCHHVFNRWYCLKYLTKCFSSYISPLTVSHHVFKIFPKNFQFFTQIFFGGTLSDTTSGYVFLHTFHHSATPILPDIFAKHISELLISYPIFYQNFFEHIFCSDFLLKIFHFTSKKTWAYILLRKTFY